MAANDRCVDHDVKSDTVIGHSQSRRHGHLAFVQGFRCQQVVTVWRGRSARPAPARQPWCINASLHMFQCSLCLVCAQPRACCVMLPLAFIACQLWSATAQAT